MAANKHSTPTWIVLVRKTPLGPFSETELKDQLSKGFIRINDLACLTSDGKNAQANEWLFLWQFPEFDRRRAENQNNPPPIGVERRSPVNRERMERDKSTQLSPALMKMTQKDLVARARNAWAQEKNPAEAAVPTHETASRNRRLGYLYWSVALLIGITVLPTILRRSGIFSERAQAVTARPAARAAHITAFPDSQR